MPFPFLPLGAVAAATVLIGALTVFGLVLRAMDRALGGLRDNVLSGLVSGLRTWESSSGYPIAAGSPAATGRPWSWAQEATATEPTQSAAATDGGAAAEIVDLGSRSIDR